MYFGNIPTNSNSRGADSIDGTRATDYTMSVSPTMVSMMGVDGARQAALLAYLETPEGRAVTRQFARLNPVTAIVRLAEQYSKFRRVERRLGATPKIRVTQVDDLLQEVSRHRWLEAEKAGRDIWQEQDPRDPEGVALRDWFYKHYASWYQARQRRRARPAMG